MSWHVLSSTLAAVSGPHGMYSHVSSDTRLLAQVDGSEGHHGTGVLGFTKFESSMEVMNCHLFDGPHQEEPCS
eukprot:4481218-Amphidinium_carterae.1